MLFQRTRSPYTYTEAHTYSSPQPRLFQRGIQGNKKHTSHCFITSTSEKSSSNTTNNKCTSIFQFSHLKRSSCTRKNKNTASFSLVYNNNDGSATEPSSRMNSINVPQLTFRDDYHASSGEGGANIAYLEASDRQNPVTVPDVTVSVNFISQS